VKTTLSPHVRPRGPSMELSGNRLTHHALASRPRRRLSLSEAGVSLAGEVDPVSMSVPLLQVTPRGTLLSSG
jgi:hypothetical protein